ncbi:hypothetical protein HYFRA_00010524 [Hymenoscyphus fraxineus]|uniref:Uncharacterized protein n=1 Tax=Hymenoscyphus fraxineus TaxID=746836 RepID=A0A9N9L626_9HELO|nr:hypothetical protein HYFRA_00010524 [Hymenoscyphus fraxineus]
MAAQYRFSQASPQTSVTFLDLPWDLRSYCYNLVLSAPSSIPLKTTDFGNWDEKTEPGLK